MSEQATPSVSGISKPGELLQAEIYWRDHFAWLQECGYTLRPRYSPNWKPSWHGTSRTWRDSEDGVWMPTWYMVDAKSKDGSTVMLKILLKSSHPQETKIAKYFASSALAADPNNHCVPPLDVLQVPDWDDQLILVMPFLRPYNDPPFGTVGEAVEFFDQIFEGLKFMHAHNVAHRDCTGTNIMMDPSKLFPDMYHPARRDRSRDLRSKAKSIGRTRAQPKYFFVDFGISRQYTSEQRAGSLLEPVQVGGDKSAPEHRGWERDDFDKSVDPFPTDVYYLGNVIREDFLQRKRNLEFIQELVQDMVQDDMSKRPTMDEVVARWKVIQAKVTPSQLKSRLGDRSEFGPLAFLRNKLHYIRSFIED